MTISRPAFIFVVVSSILIALASYRFFFLGLSLSFPGMSGHIDDRLIAFALHITLAPAALLLGAVQLFPAIQKKRTIHRWVGRQYGLCVLIAGIASFSIAFGAEGGAIAASGFALLACVWIAVTAVGVNHARSGRFADHRQWMLRSFALTFAGVTLRLQLLGFTAFGVDYDAASVFLAWSCWLPNLAVVELWLRRQASNNPNQAPRVEPRNLS